MIMALLAILASWILEVLYFDSWLLDPSYVTPAGRGLASPIPYPGLRQL